MKPQKITDKPQNGFIKTLIFFITTYFFVAEKPSPKTPTCSVINFHNLQSLLGLLGSLVSEQMESSDWCWFVVKK